MNLCTNAWQAIGDKPGRIDITLDGLEIALGAAPEGVAPGRYARLRVRDTGEGMDAQTLERIFEPFFTTKAAGRGSGLGLSVAHGIVKDHGGTIAALSREREGATFEVLLPAAAAETTATAREAEQSLPLLGQGRVLYVDDEKAVAVAVAGMLESLGYNATICHTGEEAIECVRRDPQAFDVVLTDFSMPGLSGVDVAREVARMRPDLPVILTSGYAARAGEGLAGGCVRLDKPFDRRALSEALNRVLRLRAR
jgi:CheY-like chemotaxis protein